MPQAGSEDPWYSLPRRASLWPIAMTRSGNVWIHFAISGCSKSSGWRATRPGKPGSERMRVLVTGHRGYIGSVLVDRIRTSGHDVVGVYTELYEDCTFGQNKDSGIVTINRDIRELSPSDLEGIDAIAHLAGVCNDPLGDLLPETTYDINHAATVRLADIARASGVRRFIFSSSCSVYGAAGQEWIDEQSEPNPITPYGLSKWKAEIDLRQLANSG